MSTEHHPNCRVTYEFNPSNASRIVECTTNCRGNWAPIAECWSNSSSSTTTLGQHHNGQHGSCEQWKVTWAVGTEAEPYKCLFSFDRSSYTKPESCTYDNCLWANNTPSYTHEWSSDSSGRHLHELHYNEKSILRFIPLLVNAITAFSEVT